MPIRRTTINALQEIRHKNVPLLQIQVLKGCDIMYLYCSVLVGSISQWTFITVQYITLDYTRQIF
jgi:hypothetical protein